MQQNDADGYTYFIGTDISKNKLDHAVFRGRTLIFHQVTGNDPDQITAFIEKVKKIRGFAMSRAVFVMEETGFYGNHFLAVLHGMKANIVMQDAMQIKKSLGHTRGKNDRVDAIRIAEYGFRFRDELRLWVPRRPIIAQLANLATLRSRLMSVREAMAKPLKEQALFVGRNISKRADELCQRSLEALRYDIGEVDRTITELVAGDGRLSRLMALVTSVPCVGPITALQILIHTNEFRDIRCPKKFACYAGIAPFARESGTARSRARVSNVANKKMKTLLHMCAVSALSRKCEIRDFYRRKTEEEGKHKMLVLNAVRNKLVLRVFACVAQDRFYQEGYVATRAVELFEIPSEVVSVQLKVSGRVPADQDL